MRGPVGLMARMRRFRLPRRLRLLLRLRLRLRLRLLLLLLRRLRRSRIIWVTGLWVL